MHVQDKPEVKGVLTLGGKGRPSRYSGKIYRARRRWKEQYRTKPLWSMRILNDITDPAAYQERKLLDRLDTGCTVA